MSIKKYVKFATKSYALPDVCVKLRELIDCPRSSAEDIGNLISVDSSLTAKVLRLANSSLFRFPSQIDSVAKAINVIGGEALYNLVVSETASSAFKCFDSELIDLQQHWYESVYLGMLAKHIAMRSNVKVVERFFVMGILQNLSELVVAKRSPELYQQYLNTDKSLLPYQRQMQVFGFTFSRCSGIILEGWNLPISLFYPITHVNDEARQQSDREIGLLALSNRIALSQLDKENYADIELFSPEIANIIGSDIEIVSNATDYAEQETAKIAELIN
ncbi:HDOD domain-containing protein [Alteromonas sp. BMJM2]|uniref:HDOD domain-containing protein n=1 Tax=Alteromonas sp. BMJM2 TaxID=2954241 RepID=UPI0022B474B1|nr:HDOD domain-containing protein [Alteromonas sp. BMJM2]